MDDRTSFAQGRVTVVGSFAVGLTLRADRFPVSGETVLARDFDQGPGGKGSNQAVQVARMGAPVEFVGRLGDDAFGDVADALFAEEGVGTTFLRRTSARNTGLGFIVIDAAGDNRILLDPGANALFARADVADAAAAIATSAVVMAQLEIPVEAAHEGLRLGREKGALTVLNPAPVRPLPPEIFDVADILTPNQTEARILLGLSPADPIDDMEACGRLLALGAHTVVLTRGSEGAVIVTSDGSVALPAQPVDVVDSTGAGDAFNGTLAAGLARREALEDAVARAVAAGALACTKLGVIPSLPRRADVEALLTGPSR
ncbi:MAG: ribokinase [Actinomycetota bacterium]